MLWFRNLLERLDEKLSKPSKSEPSVELLEIKRALIREKRHSRDDPKRRKQLSLRIHQISEVMYDKDENNDTVLDFNKSNNPDIVKFFKTLHEQKKAFGL